MITAFVLILAAYLLGSLSGSLLLGRLRGVDIRTQGSGNAGGTNALRTQGWRFALGTVLVDVGKGALAAWLALRFAVDAGVVDAAGVAYLAVLAAVAGHVWPVFHGFRGGKGAGTLVGGLLVLWPLTVLPLLAVWLLCLTITGYVGLATILAAAALPTFALAIGADGTRLAFALAVAVFIAFTHRGNLVRLRAGNEHRFERARVLARLLGKRPA